MFNTNAKTTWIPYKIPPTPVPETGKQYALSFSSDATPEKNPSQFLRWAVVEGGEGGEGCVGLNLYTKTVGVPPESTTQVWIGAGTVADIIPDGLDPINGKLIASSGSGQVWARVTIDGQTGDIQSVEVNGGAAPPNTGTSRRIILGSYQISESSAQVSNFACGSVYANICRNWFASSSPFYSISLFRQ
jgi:hypothetical protein